MEKLSEYIPILVILATVIFSLIGKKKKPAEVTQKTTLPEKTVEDIITEKEFPRTISSSKQKLIERNKKKPVFNERENVMSKNIAPALSSPAKIENFGAEEEIVNVPFSFEEEDDAMKAIIYSEIINRKEY
jgi:hypothetical protein